MKLQEIPKRKSKKRKAKRVGRGFGSGKGGHTVGKGMKGQKSRAGYKRKVAFEGGQTPLYRRLPHYRGQKSLKKHKVITIKLSDLEGLGGTREITHKLLVKEGLISRSGETAKIVGTGEIKRKVEVKDIPCTKAAGDKIAKAGGKVEDV